uniref:Uncharacterized protein n=1 Tax=Arundo donax TaxID=35708 RepID=A0A0A9BN92_ARUDO
MPAPPHADPQQQLHRW